MKRLTTILFFILIVSCNNFDATKSHIKDDVVFLAQDELNGRETGTEGEQKAAEFIANRFKEMGLEAKGSNGFYQDFTFKPSSDPHQEAKFTSKNEDGTITGTNVVAFLDNNAENTIVIGAHYDHLGTGGEGSLHRGEKAIHNGADDNASGVAVMLDLVRKLKGDFTNNNYLFIAFSSPENAINK